MPGTALSLTEVNFVPGWAFCRPARTFASCGVADSAAPTISASAAPNVSCLLFIVGCLHVAFGGVGIARIGRCRRLGGLCTVDANALGKHDVDLAAGAEL